MFVIPGNYRIAKRKKKYKYKCTRVYVLLQMYRGRVIALLVICSVTVHGFSISHTQKGTSIYHNQKLEKILSNKKKKKFTSILLGGRKLFGGYRIAPKVCHPTNPSRFKSESPAICMFNYECSRRRGEVVGACMDGFLFGACCQLPSKAAYDNLEKVTIPDINVHEIDHVPDIPILLNPDGTPIDVFELSTKSGIHLVSKDAIEQAEKVQVTSSDLEDAYGQLLGNEEVLDDLKMPSLLASDSNNSVQQQQNPVTTLLNPDQIFQVADPIDQLPSLFSHGLEANDTGADTILLNRNGTRLNETMNPDEIFKPLTTLRWTTIPPRTNTKTSEKIRTKVTDKMSTRTSESTRLPSKKTTTTLAVTKSSSTKKKNTTKAGQTSLSSTTPMSTLSTRQADDLVRIATIRYPGQSGNKKHDLVDNEEIAINHIISILNDTSGDSTQAKVTTSQGEFL